MSSLLDLFRASQEKMYAWSGSAATQKQNIRRNQKENC